MCDCENYFKCFYKGFCEYKNINTIIRGNRVLTCNMKTNMCKWSYEVNEEELQREDL
jgi:hypothetical protein